MKARLMAAVLVGFPGIASGEVVPRERPQESLMAPAVTGNSIAVDPELTYSTYLGGDGRDAAVDVATSAQGNVYVLGDTAFGRLDTGNLELIRHLPSFLPPVFDTTPDAFVVKYAPNLGPMEYFAVVGGSGSDQAVAMTGDHQGNAILLLRTESFDLPTRNAIQTDLRGGSDLAVVKVSANGRELMFSTYLGGSFHEIWFNGGGDIAVDAAGNVYIGGTTFSQDFPVTSGAYQPQPGAMMPNAFITKLSPTGALVYSTYLGGNGNDECHAIGVDPDGNAFVGGWTTSSNFPLVRPLNASRGVLEGTVDRGELFVAKLNSAGSVLEFSTFLIGGGSINAIALTANRGVVIAGQSTGGLTSTPNALQRSDSGGFVLELNPQLTAVAYSTHLGAGTQPRGLALDGQGNLAITGATPPTSLLTTHEAVGTSNPLATSADAFVVKLDAMRKPLYSIRIGGSDTDEGHGISCLPNGDLVFAGFTRSFDFPIVAGPRENPVSEEAFVARFTDRPSSRTGSDPGPATGFTSERYSDPDSSRLPLRFYRVRELRPE